MPEYAVVFNRTVTHSMSVDFEASSPDDALAKARNHHITEWDYEMQGTQPFVGPWTPVAAHEFERGVTVITLIEPTA